MNFYAMSHAKMIQVNSCEKLNKNKGFYLHKNIYHIKLFKYEHLMRAQKLCHNRTLSSWKLLDNLHAQSI